MPRLELAKTTLQTKNIEQLVQEENAFFDVGIPSPVKAVELESHGRLTSAPSLGHEAPAFMMLRTCFHLAGLDEEISAFA